MERKQKRKKQKMQLLRRMIAAGMTQLAIIFAAAVYAALKRCRWFSEVSRYRGARGLFIWNDNKSLPNIL